jgi:hypothetical protein
MVADRQTIRLILAENIRARMHTLDKTVREVKEGTWMSLDMVYRILRAETDVGFEKMATLANYLHTTVAELLTPMNGSAHKGFKIKRGAPRKKRD